MDIMVAAFIEGREFRQVAPDSTRIDIFGAHWSYPVAELPAQIQPHLLIIYRADERDPDRNPVDRRPRHQARVDDRL